MLGLPSATIRSGQAPSAAAIMLSWAYVVSSIVLVAELSFSAMERDGVDEVSFTGLASSTLGADLGAVVAVVYAALSFSLIVACVAGIGSLVSQLFPTVNPVLANALFPCFAGVLIAFFPFKAVDGANRALWPDGCLHHRARGDRAILIGGAVPLFMVMSWNAVILGLATAGGNARIALATSLIGYAVSFPKQLADTVELIVQRFYPKQGIVQQSNASSGYGRNGVILTWTVLIVLIFIVSFFSAAFSRALGFAGVYANCFLFGILPPVMAWIHRSQERKR
ncbi:tyrosine-specific transport protein 2 [Panicum miliaceum]|uniref:Tyrosine-specific transport protein 2 n=1 Tax=Panicum miliaceum TaxID=4540 RepID=A0A3L6SZU0_PANMI|nr:tyrosine-specific transport protein 2 [Panicum miliaceum]